MCARLGMREDLGKMGEGGTHADGVLLPRVQIYKFDEGTGESV